MGVGDQERVGGDRDRERRRLKLSTDTVAEVRLDLIALQNRDKDIEEQ